MQISFIPLCFLFTINLRNLQRGWVWGIPSILNKCLFVSPDGRTHTAIIEHTCGSCNIVETLNTCYVTFKFTQVRLADTHVYFNIYFCFLFYLFFVVLLHFYFFFLLIYVYIFLFLCCCFHLFIYFLYIFLILFE